MKKSPRKSRSIETTNEPPQPLRQLSREQVLAATRAMVQDGIVTREEITGLISAAGSPPAPGCELVLREDPKTGDFTVKPRGKCPDGYVEAAAKKIEQDGLTFKMTPKVRIEEEESGQK